MTKKLTMKEKVLRFVEARGTARFTDIQRFIVDTRFGAGTYDSAQEAGRNPYRGQYCAAFQAHHPTNGYFLKGRDRLVKRMDGLYEVSRPAVRPCTPDSPQSSSTAPGSKSTTSLTAQRTAKAGSKSTASRAERAVELSPLTLLATLAAEHGFSSAPVDETAARRAQELLTEAEKTAAKLAAQLASLKTLLA